MGSTKSQASNRMNSELIADTARQTLAGTLAFPEVVARLVAAGVESYQVDYITLRKTFYGHDGTAVETPILFENLPPVAAEFSSPALRENIRDSQHQGQSYRDFTRRAMASGVQGYLAFLRGRRVTYYGRQGDAHTEWFPGAAPQTP